MELSYNWMQDYLPKHLSQEELSKTLTSIGLEVEGVEKAEAIPGSLEGLVIGYVETCREHPNSDHLHITTVNTGQEGLLSIVCGAPNVASGQKVVVAPVGATVHPRSGEPFQIKKAKIRGEKSEGMICAEDEIGLGNSHAGIMVLPEDAPVGEPAASYFKIPAPDYTLAIGLTPNRSDGNSHIGAARDVCAFYTHHRPAEAAVWQLKLPDTHLPAASAARKDIQVSIEDEKACPRYAGIVIDGIKVAESPEWMQERLRAIGVRPINNVVDVTNYVLNEYGQPLHAFDYNSIADHHIIVKKLADQTPFVTLDGTERKLRSEDLMICDGNGGLCMAGVFGGKSSGVKDGTTTVFLESAYFDPRTIRRTSIYHQLRTDAAQHFEKGVDMEMVIPALKRAARLLVELAGGHIASELIDVYPAPFKARTITASYREINDLCGKEFTQAQILNVLEALGFDILHKDSEEFEVKVPSNKVDVFQAADLVEEVLRIDGLDNVPIPERLNISLLHREEPAHLVWEEKMAAQLTNAGFNEIITNSITNEKFYPGNTQLIKMLNSLTTELNVMRPSMLESGLEVIAYNINRRMEDLKLYEFGNIYGSKGAGQYYQQPQLAIYLTGNDYGQTWQGKAKPVDFYNAKGTVEGLLTICGIQKTQEQATDNGIVWKRGKAVLAEAQKVSRERLDLFDIKQDVYYVVIDINEWVKAAQNAKVKFTELPKFPAVYRDLALVLDREVPYARVAATTQALKLQALIDYRLFDKFESARLGPDKKSLALSFIFQLKDRTLTDDEVETMMAQLTAAYQKDLNAIIRN